MGERYDWIRIGERFLVWWDEIGSDGEVITKFLTAEEAAVFGDVLDRHDREIQSTLGCVRRGASA